MRALSKDLWGVSLLLAVQAGTVTAQETLFVASFTSATAPNVASDVTDEVRAGIGELGLFDAVDWSTLLASSDATRAMPADERASLMCIQARQFAIEEGIDAVLCGAVGTTPEGLRLELEVHRTGGEVLCLEPVVSNERESLVDHALAEIRAWKQDRRDASRRSGMWADSCLRVAVGGFHADAWGRD